MKKLATRYLLWHLVLQFNFSRGCAVHPLTELMMLPRLHSQLRRGISPSTWAPIALRNGLCLTHPTIWLWCPHAVCVLFKTLSAYNCKISALKAIETLGIRHNKGSSEYRDAMRAEMKKYTTMNVISFRHVLILLFNIGWY